MKLNSSLPAVLHLVGGIDFRGGVNRYVSELVQLKLPGFEQRIWRHQDFNNPKSFDLCLGRARFTDVNSVQDFVGALRDLPSLLRWLKRNPTGILHAHSRMGILLAYFAHFIRKVPVVITFHSFVKHHTLYRNIVRACDARVMFNSSETCRHFGWTVENDNVQTPFISWPSEAPMVNTAVRFVAAGSIVPVKQVHLMLQAFQVFRDRFSSTAEFHIFGVSPECPTPAYQAQVIAQAQSIPNTTLHEYDPNWTSQLRGNDVFVHIRPDESFGIVLLEAFARGLCMIVPPITFLNEVNEWQGIHRLRSVNLEEIAMAMGNFYTSENIFPHNVLFERRKRFQEAFSAEGASSRLSRVYGSVWAKSASQST